jgi:hypothetical protein
MTLTADQAASFWSRVDRRGPDECWPWTATIDANDYGLFSAKIDGVWKTKRAHRLAYEELVAPFPDGLTLDHLCRNRGCVNPAHLEPLTLKENILRGTCPPALNAVKTCCPKGHPYDDKNTYMDRQGWRRCRECARVTDRRWWHKRKALAAYCATLPGGNDGK